MESGLLYVIYNKWVRDPETNEIPYKIGITKKTVDDRYYGLGLKMPGKFETLFAYKIKDYVKAEQSIHTIFDKYCVNGEWYKLGEKELELVKANCEMMDGILATNEIEKEIEDETEAEYENITTEEDNLLTIKIVKAYLIDGLSHRNIEKTLFGIDSQLRGGGYIAMNKLHKLGIDGDKKGILKINSLENEIKNANGKYLETLIKYRDSLQ